MLYLYRLVLQKSYDVWPKNCYCGGWSAPCDLVAQASVVIALKIHEERFTSLCDDEHETHVIEHWHGELLEVYAKIHLIKALRCNATGALSTGERLL